MENNDLKKQSDKLTGSLILIAIVFLFGELIAATQIFNPAAILPVMMEDLSMDLSTGSVAISLIYLIIAIFLFISPSILQKIGTKASFTLGMIAGLIGGLLSYFINGLVVLFLSRIFIGMSLGLLYPSIAAIIMGYYSPKHQPFLNGMYGAIPYFSNLLALAVAVPFLQAFGGAWRNSLGIWFVAFVPAILIWIFVGKKKSVEEQGEDGSVKKSLIATVWKNKVVRSLTFIYVMDMILFAYLTGILPTYLNFEFATPLDVANNLCLAFPILGGVCAVVFGAIIGSTGRRKPILVLGQICKVIGLLLLIVPNSWIRIIGIGLLGAGGALWMPAFYTIFMDLPGFDDTKVAAAIAIASGIPYVVACIAPGIGGWLVEIVGFKITFLIWVIPAVLGVLKALTVPETGPVINKDKQIA